MHHAATGDVATSDFDYVTVLNLKRADGQWRGGLCLSRVNARQIAESASEWLHPEEYQRWQAFAYSKRAGDYLRGRYAAKHAVKAMHPSLAAGGIKIESGIFQQPILSCPAPARLDVSISHAPGLTAAVAFPSAHPMAIDVETVHPDNHNELQSQVTNNETALLKAIYVFSELELLTAMWTVKEALSKALGCGLTAPFHLFEVSEIHEQNGLLNVRFENFIQYQAVCLRWAGAICTLLFPGKSQLLQQAQLATHGQHQPKASKQP